MPLVEIKYSDFRMAKYITIAETNMTSKRTIITISEEDKRWLESYSSLHRVSVAEAIRQGIPCNMLSEKAR